MIRFVKIHGPFAAKMLGIFIVLSILLIGIQVATAEDKAFQAPCPVSTLATGCYTCHVTGKTWPAVKETPADAVYDYPNAFTKIKTDKTGKLYGYYTLGEINADPLQASLFYFRRHGISRVVVEIFSPGGSMMHAIKIVDMMRVWEAQGGIIETRCYGFAASAGFMSFVGGTIGHRFAAPFSLLMWHELISFKMFDVSSPSDKEDEARVLRFFQNKGNEWLANRCKLSKEKLDELIHKKEFWMNGTEAIEYGFADGIVGE